ncbi:methylated-DNA--[protein]-cysteine S-methyltransferase [Aerococcus urinaeequi]|uniref:Methylated-DNA--[protein]-cysteine S-methyltransferase n=1 Tax=Aerococcus urinaeequi TaxID=51665 RepID=A0A7M1KR66_9LACT|nr:methylated-DNA--[protein]-cysteine S-methyltransferase [Aerococcus urinaeequi]QOQ78672.1 methylated-DNA--[protein]-cysteine S-methyltransferase [Aerococcus urinaeequi]
MLYKYTYPSKLGKITLLANDHGLLGTWFEGQTNFGGLFDLERATDQQSMIIDKVVKWLDAYFAKQPFETIDFQLMPQGTAFQQDVWLELQKIPYGQTISLEELEKRISARQTKGGGAVNAIIGAVENNPIAIIIPSHRVLVSTDRIENQDDNLDKMRKLRDFEID